MIPRKMKRGRNSESKKEDRLSDLPDCVLLHILAFLNAKDAVRTCVLSNRWKDLWKLLSTLTLHSSDFWTFKSFTKFVSRLLTLRDGSIALLNLDFERHGCIEPHLLKRIVKYAISHNVQQLGISVKCDIDHIPPCIFSCHTLTSLKLSVCPRGYIYGSTLFPKSLSLAALTSLHLQHFTFCASDNDRAEPFSACNKLRDLIIDHCTVRDAKILCISSSTLVNFTMHSDHSKDFYKIVLSTPNLRTFSFTGIPYQQLSGGNLSSLEQVNIDAEIWSTSMESPLILFSWLLELANIKSLTVSASTLQVLYLIPELLKIKLPGLGNLKSLKVKLKSLSPIFSMALRAGKSRKAELEPSPPIPYGIVDFLLQNSPSAEVDFIDCPR
ncbi:FBD-associated F-box protein At5g18780-like [Gastrolobium bilobum]|uniref:FBD-associated F-box protein At5g18780-like n=1 Tax=Gastrolobium bilobum TaxID=150636 RepID=UPI002AB2BA38|nr:FBD-associated F-box protein At5g18780-like [Gastrolobium bilobum]